jgi:tRNA threonylcarbamoyl adenosine modification protein (Sua5/YciO/YrdC/YwlC family)
VSLTFDCADPGQRQQGIEVAAGALRGGELVVVPTDTLYGIAADAFTPTAIDALLAAKGRGRDMPVPVLVGSWTGLDGLVTVVTPQMRDLREAFWPGGLTMVVRHAPGLAWDLGDAHGTVAVRMPLHPVAIELLREVGPLGVSSANRTGRKPPTTLDDARAQLGDRVSVYLDGGATPAPVASSIVDLTATPPRLVRAGTITADQIREVVPDLVVIDAPVFTTPPPQAAPEPEPDPEPEPPAEP